MINLKIFVPLTAIEPPIALNTDSNAKPNTFSMTVVDEDMYVYSVHKGAEFGVECSSVAIEGYEFIGEVTWYKETIDMSGLCFFFMCVYVRT